MTKEKKKGFMQKLFNGSGCSCGTDQLIEGDGKESSTVNNKRGGLWLGLGSGLLALIGGIGCCGLPIIGGTLAIFGAGSGFVSAIKPWQPVFIALAVIALAYEFYKAYRPLPTKHSCCAKRGGKRLILWSVTIMLTALITIQYAYSLNPDTKEKLGGSSSINVAVDKPQKSSSSCTPTGCNTKFKVTSGFIKPPLKAGEQLTLIVLNLKGVILGTQQVSHGNYIDLTRYDDGKYILRLDAPTGRYTQAIILKKKKCCKPL